MPMYKMNTCQHVIDRSPNGLRSELLLDCLKDSELRPNFTDENIFEFASTTALGCVLPFGGDLPWVWSP